MFRPDFRVFFFNLGNRLFHQPSPFSRIEVMSIPKATSLVAGGKKKKHVTVLPGFCPPLFASNQKSAGIIVWCPSWCQQFPRFRHLSRRLYRWAGGFFLGGWTVGNMLTNLLPTLFGWKSPKKKETPKKSTCKTPSPSTLSEFSGEISLSKWLSPKLPRRNAIHLHRTATNTRLPTKPFEAANLFREFLSFWDVNQQKSRTNLEKQFKEKKLNTRARFWVIDLCLAKFLVKLGFTYIKYKTLSATWKIWTSQTWKPLAAAPDCHVLARTWGWKFARREDDECWMLLVLTYHIWLSSRSGLTE